MKVDDQKMIWRPFLVVSVQVVEFQTRSQSGKRNHLLFRMKKARMCKRVLSVRDPPFTVYLGTHWCHLHDKMDQAFTHVISLLLQFNL